MGPLIPIRRKHRKLAGQSQASNSARIALKAFIEASNYSEEELNKLLKEIVRPNGAVLASIKNWAVKHNINCIGSPFEADWQLAYLYHAKEIDYVLSYDGDIVVYGATIIKNIDFKKGTVEVYSWSNVCELMIAEFGD